MTEGIVFVDKRIAELIAKLAGDKLDIVTLKADELAAEGKSYSRAYADALEAFKLV